MADPTDPDRFAPPPDGQGPDARPPEPPGWRRKHPPEPPAVADARSESSVWKGLAMLGSVGLAIAGTVAALDSGQVANPRAVPPPVIHKAEDVDRLKQLLERRGPPAVTFEQLEARLATLEKAVLRFQEVTDWDAKDFEAPELADLFADLRRTLGETRTQLAAVDSSRLSPEGLAKRDDLAQRVENLRCTLAAMTGRDD